MIRWLAIVCLLAAPASAQVFKPKSGTTGSSSSSGSSSGSTASTTTKSKAKKSSTSSGSKKSARKGSSKKKSSAASKGRPSDLTPDDAPKVDPDYVKIIDDDDE